MTGGKPVISKEYMKEQKHDSTTLRTPATIPARKHFRRALLYPLFGLLALTALAQPPDSQPSHEAKKPVTNAPKKVHLNYINPDAPRVAAPEYPGEYYDTRVPATLDLAERARLCVNALTETTDANYDDELYWIIDLLAREPAMFHSVDDAVQAKFYQALPLNRTQCGSKQNLDVEHRLMQTMLKMQGPDGLLYIPIKGRPWALPESANPWAIDPLPTGDHWCQNGMNGRSLGAFTIYSLKDPAGPWADAARRLARGLMNLCIVEGDAAWLPSNVAEPGKTPPKPAKPPRGLKAAYNGWVAQGLAQYARVSGDREAGEMAARLMRYVMRDSGYFGPLGEFTPEFPGENQLIHFHAHTCQIMTALEAVQATRGAAADAGGSGDFFRGQWTLFGPFKKGDPEPDFAGMTDVPKELAAGGKRVAGQSVAFSGGRLDLGALLGGKEVGKTAYLLAVVDAGKDGEVKLGAGADWWMKWWANGRVVCDTLASGNNLHPPGIFDHLFTVPLKAGRNLIAVKVVGGSGSFVLAADGPVTGEQDLLVLAQRAYHYAVRQGEPLVGFFPEWLDYKGGGYGEGQNSSEICGVADMIASALKLSQLGIDKWDDVDRWVRNQFSECQLTDTGWLTDGHLKRADRKLAPLPGAGCSAPEYGTTDRVIERAVGSFSGWPSMNDFVQGNGWSIMHCCTGNGARAVYYVWKNILTHADGRLKVNLLLNRASRWADIDSHIPYRGQVDVKMKQALDLEIRLAEWVKPEDARCTVDGQPRKLTFDGRYAQVGAVQAGQTVTLTFPIPERTDRVIVEKRPYTLIRRGNDVVHIDPPGENRPLYQRGHYRQGETLWKDVRRFVPAQEIPW